MKRCAILLLLLIAGPAAADSLDDAVAICAKPLDPAVRRSDLVVKHCAFIRETKERRDAAAGKPSK